MVSHEVKRKNSLLLRIDFTSVADPDQKPDPDGSIFICFARSRAVFRLRIRNHAIDFLRNKYLTFQFDNVNTLTDQDDIKYQERIQKSATQNLLVLFQDKFLSLISIDHDSKKRQIPGPNPI
jgi:hypothetical protein